MIEPILLLTVGAEKVEKINSGREEEKIVKSGYFYGLFQDSLVFPLI